LAKLNRFTLYRLIRDTFADTSLLCVYYCSFPLLNLDHPAARRMVALCGVPGEWGGSHVQELGVDLRLKAIESNFGPSV